MKVPKATAAQWIKETQAVFKRCGQKELFMALGWLAGVPKTLGKPEQTVVGVNQY